MGGLDLVQRMKESRFVVGVDLHRRAKQIVLRLVALEDRPLGDPRPASDFRGGGGDSFLEEHNPGRPEDLLVGDYGGSRQGMVNEFALTNWRDPDRSIGNDFFFVWRCRGCPPRLTRAGAPTGSLRR